MTNDEIDDEFYRQLDNLVLRDYPKKAKISNDKFKKLILPLRKKLGLELQTKIDLANGKLPFVIVVKSSIVPSEYAMTAVEKDDKQGICKLYPHEPEDFSTIDDVKIPESDIYLLVDIDRGSENINIPPKAALKLIKKVSRSPLTIDEGIAIVTHYPEFLMRNNCFSLLASRHHGDKRVPAIWINSKKHPNLGWCWEGNPHTWLGSASCKSRIGF